MKLTAGWRMIAVMSASSSPNEIMPTASCSSTSRSKAASAGSACPRSAAICEMLLPTQGWLASLTTEETKIFSQPTDCEKFSQSMRVSRSCLMAPRSSRRARSRPSTPLLWYHGGMTTCRNVLPAV